MDGYLSKQNSRIKGEVQTYYLDKNGTFFYVNETAVMENAINKLCKVFYDLNLKKAQMIVIFDSMQF